MAEKITERSLYPPLINYLESLNFITGSEIVNDEGQLDIVAKRNNEIYIIEVKVGDSNRKLIEGAGQAFAYASQYNTHNLIVISYPEMIRGLNVSKLSTAALETRTDVFVVTKYLQKSGKITPKELFDELVLKIREDSVETVSLKVAIEGISHAIDIINSTLTDISEEGILALISTITGKFDLFKSLSELKNNVEINKVALNLVSYMIVNQILFYHIYAMKSQQIPELENLNKIEDLESQFKYITDINYKSIYQMDILSHLPENQKIVESFNTIIHIFKIIKPEEVQHDLIGRLFHELLPYETRKILATFYTNPIAADILAGLCIEKKEDRVIDPACGSGTLLVSTYKRKQYLNKDHMPCHKQFVERDIYGLDLMPFAAHLTAVNLSSQSIETTTDNLNVGVMDSLSLAGKLKTNERYSLENFSKELQSTIETHDPSQPTLFEFTDSKSIGAVSADAGSENTVTIERNSFDVCIANPPFSDREKMPNEYLRVLDTYSQLTKCCGSRINLWGYFIALCDFLLKDGGTMGFVIPINIFRGEATSQIRKYLLENYTWKYVVKTGENIAFSEKAAFRDVIIVATKKNPEPTDEVKFSMITSDLHDLTFADAKNISKYIKNEVFVEGNVESIMYRQQDLIENSENLMPYFGIMDLKTGKTLTKFLTLVQNKLHDKLRKLSSDEISEGFHASPAGVSQMTFITNNYAPERTSKGFMIYDSEDQNNLYVKIGGGGKIIQNTQIMCAARV